jgi:Ser/Thr protein kinase RdoA (MazF antagonist)
MMKTYDQLTRTGRLRKTWKLARMALEKYGLTGSSFKFQRIAGKNLFRVYGSNLRLPEITSDLFEPGQCLLRIYDPGYQDAAAIEFELSWLTAMRQEADLPVPEPIPCLDGNVLTKAVIPGTDEVRYCSLLRWVKGRYILNQARAHHYRAQGGLMARMHNFASQWKIPPGRFKRAYDWDGLFMNAAEIGLPAGESWKLLPQDWVKPFGIVASRFRQLTDMWGKGPDTYGLIHADMGVDSNVLFWRGEPRLIDFDSSGFGYWIYDLAVAIEHCREDPAFTRYRDALLGGYAEYRSLPDEQLNQMELFLAASSVYWDLWAVGATHVHPEYLEEYRQRIDREAALVMGYLASH